MEAVIQSKVLVCEIEDSFIDILKGFFQEHNLIGIRANSLASVREMLNLNIDLGCVFLCDEPNLGGKGGQELAVELAHLRPELPIFFRCRKGKSLPEHVEKVCAGVYTKGELAK